MNLLTGSVFLSALCACLVMSSVIPPEHKSRVIDRPLSDEENHFSDEVRNKDFDHQAFLGKDDAKEFDELTPDESKRRLAILYEKIDQDHDSLLTEDELTEWIQHVQMRYVQVDTNRQWTNYKVAENGTISWDLFKERTYGHLGDEKEEDHKNRGYNYHNMMNRDFRRWTKADQNNDGVLTKEEFTDFIHPEESRHMKDVIVDETIEDMDKNKDGLLNVDEYISDMWPRQGNENEEEPDWLKTEKEQFYSYRDQDKDGFMNWKEVKDWIIPPDYDHTRAEAKHLIYNADIDKDDKLSKEEVVDKYDLFVGSQATDFGEVLRKHDEF